MKKHSLKDPQSQRGAALIVSLVLLTALTLIGLSSLQVTALEGKMAGVERDYNVAFQDAESTLREAEAYIDSLGLLEISDGEEHVLTETQDDAGDFYLNPQTWEDRSKAGPSGQYIIKHVSTIEDNPNAKLNIGGYGDQASSGAHSVFRVTARATGTSGRSQVVLQTYYKKRF